MNSPVSSYGASRDRAASVSFAEIEAAARKLMSAGDYASVAAVRQQLKRGSTTTIADAMRRFWKDQAALNAGNPVALTRLPPEFADAAVLLWEHALRLSLQTAQQDDNAARARLEELKRSTESHAQSLELREKEWDMAARIRERALVDARGQVNLLLKELAIASAEVRAGNARITHLEMQIEDYRGQLAQVMIRAVGRHRKAVVKTPTKVRVPAKRRNKHRKPVASKTAQRRRKR